MVTDIAFTLGILQLLGNRVPLGLKVFLTAFAIVDDIGAVMVIAIFYSLNIQWLFISIALGLLAIMFILGHRQRYNKYIFFLLGFAMALFISGLAYTDTALINGSKTGILLGSLTAGIIGYFILRKSIQNAPIDDDSED